MIADSVDLIDIKTKIVQFVKYNIRKIALGRFNIHTSVN